FDVDEFCALIDENTRVVTVSAVQYASGFRADLSKIAETARKFDALFVVDTIQALGVVPIDVNAQLIDVIAGACHKWLLTPEGIGYLYLSKRARARIEPTLIGWVSVKNPEDYANFEQNFRGGAMAWETGTSTSSLFYALEANLKLFHQIGVKRIFDYLIKLNDFLCENLDTKKYEIVSSSKNNEKSPIVCVRNKEGLTAYELYKHLKTQNIIVASRGDRLRISPHFYNNEGDIEKLIEALP
ncbi:MAG: aminotransferase class V-fold PLP-dependent enzyme, partial [Pyrinomonadaceae bacterium]|nr:aminotransferase class V-fold PLP-dependent enzyme [Pyrinomonadaceae bacterium]